MLVDIDLTDC